MLRGRIRIETSPTIIIGRVVLVLFSLALFWYGLMVVLLALKVAPDTVNSISGYRSAFDYLAGLTPDDITDRVRLIAAIAGIVAFLLFGYLALKQFPRPTLTRSDLTLAESEQGDVTIEARAIERVAEGAAGQSPAISGASGRWSGGDLAVNVRVNRARELPDTLRDVQRRVREAMQQHELPAVPVSVVLAGFDRKQRRELN